MESPWKSTYTATSDYVGVWEYGRLQSTFDACESKHHIGSTTNGVDPSQATKSTNYSLTGIWECDTTDEEILEIPYGRAAGALMVKAGGDAQACIETIGGLSLAQIRWIASGSGRSALTTAGEMPPLDWNSVAPSDDNDGVREWSDLHDSCIDDEIILAHRSEDRIDTTILEELVLCENCAQKDSLYASTTSRFRFDAGEDRENVTDIISAPAGMVPSVSQSQIYIR